MHTCSCVGVAAAGKVNENYKVKLKKWYMEQRFERWIAEYGKTYRDEEEKAMRFQLFKASVEMVESLRPSARWSFLPEVNNFAGFTEEESWKMCHPYGIHMTKYTEISQENLAGKEKGIYLLPQFVYSLFNP